MFIVILRINISRQGPIFVPQGYLNDLTKFDGFLKTVRIEELLINKLM